MHHEKSKALQEEKEEILMAIVGSPNVGKSTLFNMLTGKLAEVANWPGVTAEIEYSRITHEGNNILVIDLPGIYSLVPQSREEAVARDFIIKNSPDVVLAIADITNLEKSLYLVVQVLELFPKVVVALNKSDLSHKRGIHVNVEKLSRALKVPVIPISARTHENFHRLLDDAVKMAKSSRSSVLTINYGFLEHYIEKIANILSKYHENKRVARVLAIHLLEGDKSVLELLDENDKLETEKILEEVSKTFGGPLAAYIAGKRYEFIDKIAEDAVVRVKNVEERLSKIFDRIFYTPVVGFLVSVFILLFVFIIAIGIGMGAPLTDILCSIGAENAANFLDEYNPATLIDEGFSLLSEYASLSLDYINAPKIVSSIVVDGIIGGVGVVATFIPPILLFYLLFSILEDSGIYARMAVSMSKMFEIFGLTPRAAFPMILALGCNVPAVVASRTSTEETERKQIIFAVPMIPCQARLVVLIAMSAYFNIGWHQALFVVTFYLLGIFMYLATSLFTRRFIYKQKSPPTTIIEIPSIHRPSLRVVWWTTLRNVKHFVRRIIVVILPLSVVAVVLTSYGLHGYAESPQETFGYYIGKIFSVLFYPIGITGEKAWVVGYGVLNGIIAKEVFIASIESIWGNFYALLGTLTSAQVVALTAFVNLYIPCFATLAMMLREGHRKLLIQHLIYAFGVSYTIMMGAYAVVSILS